MAFHNYVKTYLEYDVSGVMCATASLIILFMDLRYPDLIATFFGVDALQDYEEFYVGKKQHPIAQDTKSVFPLASFLKIRTGRRHTPKH